MPKKLNEAAVAADIADEFLTRLGNILASAGDGIDESIDRDEHGWKASGDAATIQFDIVAGTEFPNFIVRELQIKNVAGLPGKVHRLIAEFSDRYHLDVVYEAVKIPEHSESFLHFLQRDIGCVFDEEGQLFVRHPQH